MSMSQLVDDSVQMSLLSTSGHAGLAIDLLSDRFGLSRPYAESVLEQGYGLLIPRIGAAQARKAVPLLAALGLRVAIQPVEAMPPDEFSDVSIRVIDPKVTSKLIAALGRLMDLTGLTAESFCGPSGLVLTGLSPARAEWLCTALRKLIGVHATVSEHQTALYDLFAQSDLSEKDDAEIRRFLRLLGAATGGFGDAVGTGLERCVLNRILDRFQDIDLVGVNQAFQRHELLIIGKGSLSLSEFADFLMTRPVAQSIPMRKLMESLPLRVEAGLTRTAAKQFLADYSAIGMQAITRLVWAPQRLLENP